MSNPAIASTYIKTRFTMRFHRYLSRGGKDIIFGHNGQFLVCSSIVYPLAIKFLKNCRHNCLFALNKYFFLAIVPVPYQMAKNKLPLVRRFQRAIICPQRTNIGEDIEVWPRSKVSVNGRIMSFSQKIEKKWDSIYFFFVPWRAFLVKPSCPSAVVAPALW